MEASEWLRMLGDQFRQTPLLQWVGVSFSVAEVLLARANKVWLYPAGIIGIVIAIYNLYEVGLYAECVLNAYYLIMSIYGWWNWESGRDGAAVAASYSSRRELLTAAGITSGGFVILYTVLAYFTPSDVPAWDAWVSATAWAGMWLLAKRKIENWIFLNISNAFAVPLLMHKQLPLYAVLTCFLFVVAVQGFFRWRQIIREQGRSSDSVKIF